MKLSHEPYVKPSLPYKPGDIVWHSGHEFRVTEFSVEFDEHLKKRVYRWRGVCTDHPCNNSIRGTCYDGGRYGGLMPHWK